MHPTFPRDHDITLPGRSLLSLAGVLGVAGIVVAAAGTHAGGGDLARLASTFLLIHAVAVLGLGVAVPHARRPWVFWMPALLLVLGVGAFSGDLTVLAFTGSHVVRFLAPVGGFLLILGWSSLVLLPWIGRRVRPAEL